MTAFHHFVPTYEPGAVGNHIAQVQRLCHELGWQSEVFTEHLRGLSGRDYRDYPKLAKAGDVLVYHTAIGSPVADFVTGRSERVVVDHHNLTPVEHFAAWEPWMVHALAWGRAQLASMAPRTTLGIGDSTYNESELRAVGYGRTAVAPIILDLADFDREVDAGLTGRLREESDGGAAWLFVGRIAPNKGHHDLMKGFAAYRRVYDGRARLRIVGGSASDRYVDALHAFRSALQLDDAITFTGAVSDSELAAHYDAADVYVSTSDHEGFCVPVLEAMHHGTPVVAYASTAVPETVGSGGICLPAKEPSRVAAAVHRVLSDATLRSALVASGRTHLHTHFSLEVTRARMRAALESVG